jgi:murein DD-endopeptidase MepM/ murein hydrolase activator NlpD
MKKFLLVLLIALPIYLSYSLYFLDKTYFLCPIEYEGDLLVRNDNRGDGFFGASRNGKRLHQGIDFLADIGTPVLASRSGRVACATQNRGMGKYIVIQHPAGLVTIYGHLSQIFVAKNNFVRQGEVIGAVGKTGNANYRDILPHLHFEVRKDGIPQDPQEYLE